MAEREEGRLSDEQEIDADLATAIGLRVLNDPKTTDGLSQLLSAAEPQMALGQFIAQLVLNIKEQAEGIGMPIDDMVWLADGGVVDRLIDQASMEVEAAGFDIPRGSEAGINEEVLNVLKLASRAGTGQGPQPPAGGPPLMEGAQSPMGRPIGGMVGG